MKFSVLLNNYNYGRYLQEAIQSVLNQTHTDFELIIVDDGSTDISRSLIAGFQDKRIVPILKENGGQGSAFKAGFAQASGDYLAFLDADDLWDINKLQRCCEILSREPDIVLLNHAFRQFGDAIIHKISEVLPSGIYDLEADLRRHKTDFSLVPTSFFVGRVRECKQLQFEEQDWRIAADTPVIIGLALRGKVYNLGETLGSYRIHGSNLWSGRFVHDDPTPSPGNSAKPAVKAVEDPMYLYYQRFYRLANEELKRQKRPEQFDFYRTDIALSQRILQTNKLSPQGIYWRLLKGFRNVIKA